MGGWVCDLMGKADYENFLMGKKMNPTKKIF